MQSRSITGEAYADWQGGCFEGTARPRRPEVGRCGGAAREAQPALPKQAPQQHVVVHVVCSDAPACAAQHLKSL